MAMFNSELLNYQRVYPNSWMVDLPWKFENKMDDDWGYSYDFGNLQMMIVSSRYPAVWIEIMKLWNYHLHASWGNTGGDKMGNGWDGN
jgi:hypothetical protein